MRRTDRGMEVRYAMLLLMPVLAVAGCSGAGDDGEATGEPVAQVSLARAATGDVAQTITIYGEIERSGRAQVVLGAPMEAIVERIDAPAGATVAAGGIVARLRPSPASRAQLQAAKTDASAAAAALSRAERLRADGLASDADVEAARARSAAASALAASLAERRSALLLRAPGAGFVDAVAASPGELVQPGSIVATITRSGNAQARFGIDPARARSIAAGFPLEIHAGDGSPPFAVPIKSVSPVASAQTRLASVVADIPASHGLTAGLPLSARIVTRASRRTVSVPYAALLDDGGQPYVFVVIRGVAHRRDVRIGADDGQAVAILSGVREGDMVVIDGGTGIEDGMKVRSR